LEAKFIIWQATLWDKFAKIVPFVIVLSILIFYYFDYRDWDLIFHVGLIAFISLAVVWWLWVVYTIGTIAVVLNNSNRKLVDVLEEIKKAQKEVYELRTYNRKRGKP
jgi:hypothetical protein